MPEPSPELRDFLSHHCDDKIAPDRYEDHHDGVFHPLQVKILQKALEAFNDVFADIVNGLLFQGEQVISETSLTDAQPLSMYKADGKLHEQEQDVAKYWNMAASAGRGD